MDSFQDNHNPPQSTWFEEPDDLVAAARDYFAGDFPNPTRDECPSAADLKSIASSEKLPDETLLRHLFGCSPCFCAFKKARELHAHSTSQYSFLDRFRYSLLHSGRAISIGAALLVALTIIGFLWVEFRGTANRERLTSVMAEKSPPSVMATVAVDLNGLPNLRHGAQTESNSKAVLVGQAKTRFVFTLADGSLAGKYQVALLDAFGKQLVTTDSNSDGRLLEVTLDCQLIKEGRYRVSVARHGEAPDYYPIVVTGSNPKN